MTLIDKINLFERSANQTVAKFNKIFTGNELSSGNLEDEVEIGAILGPVNVRSVYVNGKEFAHKFHAQVLPGAEQARSFNHLMSGVSMQSILQVSNANTENTVLEEREMEMDPLEYVLLQYFRGSASPYHTQVEIATKLRKSSRGIRNTMKKMEEGGIIKAENVPTLHKIRIEISEEWL